MTIPKETLMAYVDGELPAEEARTVEAELAKNADLRAYAQRQQALARRLHDSMDVVLETPLPEKLLKLVEAPAARTTFTWRRLMLWSGLPAAAALACGLALGVLFHGPADIVSTHGTLVARGTLAAALDQELAADNSSEIGISFRDKNGHYCRTFRTRQNLAGLACHENGAWQIAAAGKVAADPSGAYQPAASAMPDFVRQTVTSMIAGTPLDADAERKARAQGWRQ